MLPLQHGRSATGERSRSKGSTFELIARMDGLRDDANLLHHLQRSCAPDLAQHAQTRSGDAKLAAAAHWC